MMSRIRQFTVIYRSCKHVILGNCDDHPGSMFACSFEVFFDTYLRVLYEDDIITYSYVRDTCALVCMYTMKL
jgi:hypothetical protein